MKNIEDKYDKILHKLRETNPILNQPEDMTARIMANLTEQKTLKPGKIILYMRPWISTAAVFLIGLFIYQQNDIPANDSQQDFPKKRTLQINSYNCLEAFIKGENESFLESYSCYVKQAGVKSKSSEQLILKFKQKF